MEILARLVKPILSKVFPIKIETNLDDEHIIIVPKTTTIVPSPRDGDQMTFDMKYYVEVEGRIYRKSDMRLVHVL